MFSRRHFAALILVSTVFAVAACTDDPTFPGPRGPEHPVEVRSQTVQVQIDNRSRWDLSFSIEGEETEVFLGLVQSRSDASFAVVRDDLGGVGVLTRIRADGPSGTLHSGYAPAFSRIRVVIGENGQLLSEADCNWEQESEVCRF